MGCVLERFAITARERLANCGQHLWGFRKEQSDNFLEQLPVPSHAHQGRLRVKYSSGWLRFIHLRLWGSERKNQTLNDLEELLRFDRLREIGIHPCRQTALAISFHRVGRQCYDGNVR